MNEREDHLKTITRRHFFNQCATGMGSIALASLLNENLFAAPRSRDPMAVAPSHFAPKAKNVIYMHMSGAPSQLDLFDNKPKLVEFDGQPCPADVLEGEQFALIRGPPKILGSPY